MTMTLRAVVEIVMTGLLIVSLAAIIITVTRVLRRPMSGACSSEMFTVVLASGDACGLEHTVQSLLWLCENGKLSGTILISDCGLSDDARKMAEILADTSSRVTLCTQSELPQFTRLNIGG